jgi:formylglycine-generating enzyme required for sulfatase activity
MCIYLENGMMKRRTVLLVAVCVLTGIASADTFGTGANEFTIDFVTISGDTNPTSGYGIVTGDYRMGRLEITNDQWNKFQANYGAVTGNPSDAYDESPYYYTGTNVPTNEVSWYEAAQFVNYLNTSSGHAATYKFTGTQGTSDYTMTAWDLLDNGYDSSNPFRNSDAKYFLPTEDEWVKATYWNGTSLQTYATKPGESLTQGDGTSGTGWNYHDGGFATNPSGPWDVGSGSEELNGTFDMMGNVWEWMESPYLSGNYSSGSSRGVRGSSYGTNDSGLSSSFRGSGNPSNEYDIIGFRVASVPEPCSLVLLGLGGLVLRKRLRR